jgi:hypothetical protein
VGVTDNAKELVERLRLKRIANDRTIDPEVRFCQLPFQRLTCCILYDSG